MTPRWLHALAIVTLLATLPLLTLGAEVTSKGVGWAMVDSVGMREPWYMFTMPMREMGLGWVVEHSHRTAGYLVGFFTIALACSLWLCEPRRGVCWLGTAALIGVSVQGIFGATRVSERSDMLAMFHGLFAPLVVAMLAGVAWLTSRAGQGSIPAKDAPGFRRASLVALGVVYLQMMLGALVRRHDLSWGGRAHLLFAFVVVGVVVWLAWTAMDARKKESSAPWSLRVLFLLLAVQLMLGVEAWLSKFKNDSSPWNQLVPAPVHVVELRSLHYVAGTLLFATCAVLVLQAHRGWKLKPLAVPSTAFREGAA